MCSTKTGLRSPCCEVEDNPPLPNLCLRYLCLCLDLGHSDHGFQSEVLAVLLVHLAVHPHHGVVQLLVDPGHLQLIQVVVLLILPGETMCAG